MEPSTAEQQILTMQMWLW